MAKGREHVRPRSDFWAELKQSQPLAFLLGMLAVTQTMLGLGPENKR